jgi:transcriptional regulator with XRE-family HTH domain
MTDLADELRRMLVERGLSLREIARRAGCSPGYLSNAAHGRKPLTPSVASRLDQVLGTGGTFAAYALNPPPGGGARPDGADVGHADGRRVTADAVEAPAGPAPDNGRSGAPAAGVSGASPAVEWPAWLGGCEPREHAVPPAGLATAAITADIAMIRSALDALTSYERQFGGGTARRYAMDYLRQIVWPRLHGAADDAAFSDLCALAAEFSLRVASMQLDMGNARASRDFLAAALPLAQQAGSPAVVAWVLARLGELDVRERNVGRAVAYSSGAAAMAESSAPRARSFILAKHALALSLTGDRAATLRMLGRACDGTASTSGGEPQWMRCYGVEHFQHDEARCLNNLGLGDQAIRSAEESMRARRLNRPRAFSLAVQAIAHLRSKDNAVDAACHLTGELVTITAQLASDRVKVELARVLAALRPYESSAAVREVTEAARQVLRDSSG